MRSSPKAAFPRWVANTVLWLLVARSRGANSKAGEPGAADDLSAIGCLKDASPDRLTQRRCAEFQGPDGRLIWEEGQ